MSHLTVLLFFFANSFHTGACLLDRDCSALMTLVILSLTSSPMRSLKSMKVKRSLFWVTKPWRSLANRIITEERLPKFM